ncbi:zinc finger protein GAI-ASSOCIATED FACTOR 1-like [Gastrolobium bilobum]|uniref:zinc finger protein GAI-ASSOCIATED FACTOR 1-like n=1 Tax=Gastrolobium bilobum TaxID=150636 RepID=UPI002AB1D7D1|nr:zinc finger protein GAI-ASSOCIATED FACTOR 1-like [Gastrolobium bilobum]
MTEPHNNPSPPLLSTATGEATVAIPPPPPKKKRSLPGMPDPDAEVISLSPKTLLTTNRFVCEICNKGFQRDQNLQLHRRGHNLPWKLRQRESKEIRKKVYVCPEASCVHHNPSRALGDLTGIKKHFCRKHGEKKWKCERCSKKYAVQSDWKAHMKTCGTREYRCHCGTLFSRRDSFMTHRASCNVLAEESGGPKTLAASPPTPPLTPSSHVVSPSLSIHSSDIPENPTRLSPTSTSLVNPVPTGTPTSSTTCSTVFASVLTSSTAPSTSSFSNLMSSLACSDCPTSISTIEPTSLSLSTSLYLSNNEQSLFPDQHDLRHYTAPQPALSATALLQKAAQMGASNASLLRGLGLTTTSFFGKDDTTTTQWNGYVKQEADDNLGLGLPCGNEGVMMGSSPPFVGQPMTRDLLGLSIGVGASRGGLSALLTPFEGNLDSSGDRGVQP